jgi:hypothetical protein
MRRISPATADGVLENRNCRYDAILLEKIPMRSRFLILLGLLLACGPACAQDDDLPDPQDLAQGAAQRFPQPVRVGDLIDRYVLEPVESQPILGRVRAVVKEPDGTIAVVMD